MEQGDNISFEDIINGNEFGDDRLSRALDMFDTETNDLYKSFDTLTEEIKVSGTATSANKVSLDKKGYSLELVINEILHQDYDFDTKVAEICGVAKADMSDLARYIANKLGLEHTKDKREMLEELDKLFEGHVYELDELGMDIPRSFSGLYMTVTKTMLDQVIVEMAARYFRDNQ